MRKLIALLVPCLFFLSCRSTQEYAYISDAQRDSAMAIVQNYNSTIRSGDQLYIYVQSQDAESVLPFNQETNKLVSVFNTRKSETKFVDEMGEHGAVIDQQMQAKQQMATLGLKPVVVSGYLVDQQGNIQFPILGALHVAGLTQDSLCVVLQNRLIDGKYVKDPVVTTSLMNFRVTVAGEVTMPNEYYVAGSRLTIFEALALAQDITIYGLRDNVTVIRDENGLLTPYRIDLTKAEVLDSPCYYLRSNDIVYVEPNDKKKKLASRNDEIPGYVSTTVSGLALINSVVRTIAQLRQMK